MYQRSRCSRRELKKAWLLSLIFLALLPLVFGTSLASAASNPSSKLTSEEEEIVSRINGTNVYNYDLGLENIALNHSISGYAFRSGGSVGATATAFWIKRQFESFGLEAYTESFEFTTWNLPTQPALIIDDDGNNSTVNDQEIIKSFQAAHFSWPTPKSGIFGDLVVLPLPDAVSREDATRTLNTTAWQVINTTGKILLIGREVRRNTDWFHSFVNKLILQPPAAIIYTWWYQWMSFTPPMFGSSEGRSSGFRPSYWDAKIPVGFVNYEDGLRIRNREQNLNVSANFAIPTVIGTGPHYNVIGKLKGSVDPNRIIIISGHYDTVMTSGFCDNGAGTAGVLELARVFADAVKEGLYKPRYTLLFIAFASEELGFVGSINYIKQHMAEINNITAVINLDSIGSDTLEISNTFPNDDGLDLDEVVLKAAEDLGTTGQLVDPGGSDQEAFRNPKEAHVVYYDIWQLNSGMNNASRVKASIMISSYPLFYSSVWDPNGTAGWIHTQYDNSTSTSTLNWVEVGNLETQVQVAGLAVLRVLADVQSPLLSQILTVTMMMSVVILSVVFLKRSWVNGAMRRAYSSILSYIGMRELVVIVMLTILFLFISYVSHVRVETIEITVRGWPSPILMSYYGYPFEMIGIQQKNIPLASPQQSDGAFSSGSTFGGSYDLPPQMLWSGIFENLILFSLLAFAVTYSFERLRWGYASRESA